jgi:hypothetical protein
MNRRHGTTYVVKYLKASQLAVQRYLAGTPLQSFRELEPELPLPRLSSRGLPTIILSRDLALIGNKGQAAIRFWLSLFSLYRIIEIPSKVKLSTITDPFNGSAEFLQNFIAGVPNGIVSLNNFVRTRTLPAGGLLCILKGGPGSSKNSLTYISDVIRLSQQGLLDSILRYAHLTGNSLLFQQLQYIISRNRRSRFDELVGYLPPYTVGKLALKLEPAGKVRVFAMVDAVTQSLLHPLHS